MKRTARTAAQAAALVVLGQATGLGLLGQAPAYACVSCGHGPAGSNSDFASIGGSATMFGGEGKFLLQTSLSFRDVTGSFNDRGSWTAKPQGSSLTSLGYNLSLTYYPQDGIALGLALPIGANRLAGAQWGPQGAISPVDAEDGVSGPRAGAGLGDLALQGSYVLFRGSEFLPAVAAWSGVSLPTGQASGDPSGFTGTGILGLQAGLSVLQGFGPLEVSVSAGYQQPLYRAQGASSAFAIDAALLGQIQADLEILPGWKVGLGASAYGGRAQDPGLAATAATVAKLQLAPTAEWRIDPAHGLRLSYGAVPGGGPWVNVMTDETAQITYFRYF